MLGLTERPITSVSRRFVTQRAPNSSKFELHCESPRTSEGKNEVEELDECLLERANEESGSGTKYRSCDKRALRELRWWMNILSFGISFESIFIRIRTTN